jgi:hypothetical protein
MLRSWIFSVAIRKFAQDSGLVADVKLQFSGPARSLDFSPFGSFFQEYLKTKMYANTVDTREELEFKNFQVK